MDSHVQTVQSVLRPAIDALRSGEIVLLLDDVNASTVGYFIADAARISEDQVSFLVNYARGILCAAISETHARELGLSGMVSKCSENTLEFTVSVEAREGVSTGISSADRAKTLQVLATTNNPKLDLVMPGHIFPVKAKQGGVLVRPTIAEAATDLFSVAQIGGCAAFSHCLDDKGGFASEKELRALASKHSIPTVRISDIVQHKLSIQSIIEFVSSATLPTLHAGTFTAICFRSLNDNAEHLALVKGNIGSNADIDCQDPVMVRVQSEDRLDDLLGLNNSKRRSFIIGAQQKIDEHGKGVFIYIRHPRKGFLQAHVQQLASGHAPPKMVRIRDFGIGAQILSALGVHRVTLLSNSGNAIPGLSVFGIEVLEHIPFSRFSEPECSNKNTTCCNECS